MTGKYQFTVLFLFFTGLIFSQITGTVQDPRGESLPYVNIYTEDGRSGTTTNEDGNYSLKLSAPGAYTLVFQYLGFETLRKDITIDSFPFTLNVQLTPTTTSLDEVIVNSNENPANKIIRNAMNSRKSNLARLEQYTADYYSRGLWRSRNAAEKTWGQDIGDRGGGLDATRGGIGYVSETISEIACQSADDCKEQILASKVSGNDNGFSVSP